MKIVRRIEPDPVDVVFGDTRATATADDAARRDTAGRGDDSDTARRHDSGDTTPPGDTTTATPATQRHDDTGDSDMTTRRQTTATSPGVATFASDASRPGDVSPDGDTTVGEGDMTPTSAPPGSRTVAAARPDEPVRSTSFSIPPSLTARLRAAQWHTQTQPDGHHNVSELVRRMITAEVTRLEGKYNRGAPFPEVGRLRTGPSPEGAVRGAEIRARNRAAAAAQEDPAPPRQSRRTQEGASGQKRKNPASEGREAGGR